MNDGIVATEMTDTTSTGQREVPAWVVNNDSSQVKFNIKNFGISVNGTMGKLKVLILFDDKDLRSSRFESSVEVSSVNTGINKRDRDLMGDKFFNEEKYKQIIFRSDSIVHTKNGFMAIGSFTIKGKTRHRNIPFTFEQFGNIGIFKSDFTINRLDFNLGGNGPVMGTDVNVSIKIRTRKKQV
jgi:polyisoprenoid-binding protein YceI